MILPLLALLAAQRSTAQTPLNIKTAIDLAITNNYSLKADSMNLLTPAYQTKIWKADFQPQVNYSSKAEYNLAIASQMVPGSMIGQPAKDYVPVQFGTRYGMGSGVEVTQNIVRKSSRIQINAADLYQGIAQTRHNLTREELVYKVSTGFYALQANAEMIRTTARDYENMLEILRIAKAQYEHGTLKRIDLESLQINAANKRSYLNQLQTQYNDQLAKFNYLLGIPAETQTLISDSIPQVSNAFDAAGSIVQREDIRLYSQLIQSKEVELKSIRAEARPVVSSYFRFNYQSQFNDAGKAFNNDYWFKSSSIGITASIPIFDGYRRRNRANIAQVQLQQLKFQEEERRQFANTEWVTANENLKNDRVQYQITQRNLELAEKVFNSRKALYAEGVTSLVELLDAEKELSNSRNLHINAMINVQTSMVNVHKAKGTLLSEFLQTL